MKKQMSAAQYKLQKSLVEYLLTLPEDTTMDDMELYHGWQRYSGFALRYPEDVAHALEYLESVKNCPRSLLREVATLNGYI